MKLVKGLLLALVCVPSMANARPIFSCYGDQLDLDGSELGKGDISVEFFSRGKKLRLIYDGDRADAIELELNHPGARDLVYTRYENGIKPIDGVSLLVKADFLESTPNDKFYLHIYKSTSGRADRFRTLECRGD